MAKTPQEVRNIRLKNEYQEMVNIRGEIVQWEAIRGAAPYIEEYKLRIKLRTIVGVRGNIPQFHDEHEIGLVIPPDYPDSPPNVQVLNKPYPFHPNWFRSGRWCFGSWGQSESLGEFVIRMLQTLQYDPQITNAESEANDEANNWYKSKLSSGMFPIDRTVLPDPSVDKRETSEPKKAFNIVEQKSRFKINE